MKRNAVGIIGYGNMGQSLARGIGMEKRYGGIVVFDKDKKKLRSIKRASKMRIARSIDLLLSSSDVVIIAVKPQDIKPVLIAMRHTYSGQLIIPIAAGITTSYVEKHIGNKCRVVRVMPNLAAKISMGVSALCGGRFASKADLKRAKCLFECVGCCVVVKEKDMDSITAVSGSGPGYLYYFLYCLQAAAVKLGFSEETARFLVLHTVKGAARLMDSDGQFLDLTSRVASKGGTTEAALKYFKKRKMQHICEGALKKARLRAAQLAR